MKQERALGMLVAAGAIASLGLCPLAGAAEREVQRVLVISVDGLHAVDAERFIASRPQSALAEIARHAVRYTAASTSRPSDSFPGLLSIVTGGSPALPARLRQGQYDLRSRQGCRLAHRLG